MMFNKIKLKCKLSLYLMNAVEITPKIGTNICSCHDMPVSSFNYIRWSYKKAPEKNKVKAVT